MNKKEEYKLYILVRRDMSPEQQAVQAGHAVAKFVKDYPKSSWTNGTLIYLSVTDVKSFTMWNTIFGALSHKTQKVAQQPLSGLYYDQDLHGQDATAAYFYGRDCSFIFRDLSLMRFR